MSDLDRIVGQLRQDVADRRWPEPNQIRSRGARRTVGQVVAGVAAAVAVLVAGSAGAFAIAHGGTDHGIPASTVSPSPTSAPSPSVSAGPSSLGPITRAPSLLSAGSTVDDLTFVSPTVGWLLAATPCPAGTCLAIVHTTDGGHTWTRLPAPPSDVPADVPGLGAHLRFANARIGYLYSSSPSAFYSTGDGGSTWVAQQGPTHAIEVANGTALRVTSTVPDCQPGCSFRIVRAPIGSDQWTTVNTPAAAYRSM